VPRLVILLALFLASMSRGGAGAAEDPAHCLALSLYFEAKAEGREGMEAVGWVVLNRMLHEEFPDRVCAVIKDGGETPPCQFSWWCDGRSDVPQEAEPWQLAQEVARDLLADPPPDPTDGALFFHAGGHPSGFHAARGQTARVNNHLFYR